MTAIFKVPQKVATRKDSACDDATHAIVVTVATAAGGSSADGMTDRRGPHPGVRIQITAKQSS